MNIHFLKKRIILLENFFNQLIFNKKYEFLLDSGIVKDFLFQLIWNQKTNETFKDKINYKITDSKVKYN